MKTAGRQWLLILVGLLLGLLGVWEPWMQDELWSDGHRPAVTNSNRADASFVRSPRRATHPDTDPELLPTVTPPRDQVRV